MVWGSLMRISAFTRFRYNSFLSVDMIQCKVFISAFLVAVTSVYSDDKLDTILLFLNQSCFLVSYTSHRWLRSRTGVFVWASWSFCIRLKAFKWQSFHMGFWCFVHFLRPFFKTLVFSFWRKKKKKSIWTTRWNTSGWPRQCREKRFSVLLVDQCFLQNSDLKY